MPRTIIVAADDSKHSVRAVDVVRELAHDTGDEVVVLHVHEVAVGQWGHRRIDESGDDGFLDGLVARLTAGGVRARAEVREAQFGHIADLILETAGELGARLIAVGSRGRSDIAAIALGSVSHQLVNHAGCPVLVVRGV